LNMDDAYIKGIPPGEVFGSFARGNKLYLHTTKEIYCAQID
jgi:hypothetical protein